MNKRIIPCLDTKDGKLVKGIHFVDIIELGDPVRMALKYAEQGAEEVVFLDISATHENLETNWELMANAAKALPIPLTVGGGVRSMADFKHLFDKGVAKVSVNSAAISNPALISEASAAFGSERIVVAIDGKRIGGKFNVVINGGRKDTGIDVIEWAKKCQELGAGEILLTSMDTDGVQSGYDIEMTAAVCNAVKIPVVASGGCGKIDDIITVFKKTNCDAALAASLFHYGKATVGEVKSRLLSI
jgi:cyclase